MNLVCKCLTEQHSKTDTLPGMSICVLPVRAEWEKLQISNFKKKTRNISKIYIWTTNLVQLHKISSKPAEHEMCCISIVSSLEKGQLSKGKSLCLRETCSYLIFHLSQKSTISQKICYQCCARNWNYAPCDAQSSSSHFQLKPSLYLESELSIKFPLRLLSFTKLPKWGNFSGTTMQTVYKINKIWGTQRQLEIRERHKPWKINVYWTDECSKHFFQACVMFCLWGDHSWKKSPSVNFFSCYHMRNSSWLH